MFKVGDIVICRYSSGVFVKGEIIQRFHYTGNFVYQYKVGYFTYTSNGSRQCGYFSEKDITFDKQYYRKLKLNKLFYNVSVDTKVDTFK